jgi:hypothetical protein
MHSYLLLSHHMYTPAQFRMVAGIPRTIASTEFAGKLIPHDWQAFSRRASARYFVLDARRKESLWAQITVDIA